MPLLPCLIAFASPAHATHADLSSPSRPCFTPTTPTAINGDEGVLFPRMADGIRGDVFKQLYNHPAADIRSKQSEAGRCPARRGRGDCPSRLLLFSSRADQTHLASGPSRVPPNVPGAPGLSDVFWYFLHPASYIHQVRPAVVWLASVC